MSRENVNPIEDAVEGIAPQPEREVPLPPIAQEADPETDDVDVEASSAESDDDGEEGPTEGLQFRRPSGEAEMDMTPMVDVTFLLLIFFMVTAAFTLQKSLQIPKPEPPDETAQSRSFQEFEDNPDYVTVHVDEYGTYRVVTVDFDREAYSESELLRNLRDARAGSSGGHIPKHLLVRAHGDALHAKVVSALDAGTAVGMEDVQLLTVEDEE